MSFSPLRIGVIGSSSTVARLAVMPAIAASQSCVLAATASVSDPAATYDSYESLLDDESVEAVYLPLPNSMHREWTERAAAAGRHVLCEKPLAPTAEDGVAMARACSSNEVVLMEAYMTMFHPRQRRLSQLVGDGVLGELVFATSRFTGTLDRRDDHRWRPEMGGGALLDLGIYCLAPLLAAAGVDPSEAGELEVAAAARRNEHGVDTSLSAWIGLGAGRGGAFTCSFEAPECQHLEIVGTTAAVSIDRAFTPSHDDTTISFRDLGGSRQEISTEGADPYLVMVEHFAAAIRQEIELERTPEQSIGLQRVIDGISRAAMEAAT